jgi:hypothetical protein
VSARSSTDPSKPPGISRTHTGNPKLLFRVPRSSFAWAGVYHGAPPFSVFFAERVGASITEAKPVFSSAFNRSNNEHPVQARVPSRQSAQLLGSPDR